MLRPKNRPSAAMFATLKAGDAVRFARYAVLAPDAPEGFLYPLMISGTVASPAAGGAVMLRGVAVNDFTPGAKPCELAELEMLANPAAGQWFWEIEVLARVTG